MLQTRSKGCNFQNRKCVSGIAQRDMTDAIKTCQDHVCSMGRTACAADMGLQRCPNIEHDFQNLLDIDMSIRIIRSIWSWFWYDLYPAEDLIASTFSGVSGFSASWSKLQFFLLSSGSVVLVLVNLCAWEQHSWICIKSVMERGKSGFMAKGCNCGLYKSHNAGIFWSNHKHSPRWSSAWTCFFSNNGGDRQESLDAFFSKKAKTKMA